MNILLKQMITGKNSWLKSNMQPMTISEIKECMIQECMKIKIA